MIAASIILKELPKQHNWWDPHCLHVDRKDVWKAGLAYPLTSKWVKLKNKSECSRLLSGSIKRNQGQWFLQTEQNKLLLAQRRQCKPGLLTSFSVSKLTSIIFVWIGTRVKGSKVRLPLFLKLYCSRKTKGLYCFRNSPTQITLTPWLCHHCRITKVTFRWESSNLQLLTVTFFLQFKQWISI